MNKSLYDKAICFAVNAHAGQKRKGTEHPYIEHPLEASTIAGTITDDENVLAASVLHDVLEDTETEEETLRELFGEYVLSLVKASSEDKRKDISPKDTWFIRKQERIDAVKKMTRDEKIVSISDKLSNLRSMDRDYSAIGEDFWKRFNEKKKESHGWYYKSVFDSLKELEDTEAYKEYEALLSRVFGL